MNRKITEVCMDGLGGISGMLALWKAILNIFKGTAVYACCACFVSCTARCSLAAGHRGVSRAAATFPLFFYGTCFMMVQRVTMLCIAMLDALLLRGLFADGVVTITATIVVVLTGPGVSAAAVRERWARRDRGAGGGD